MVCIARIFHKFYFGIFDAFTSLVAEVLPCTRLRQACVISVPVFFPISPCFDVFLC